MSESATATPLSADAAAFSMELRIVTEGLAPGMYVSRLDMPWKDAGFAIEGWLLRSEEEVGRVRAACRHVHVDLSRGKSPDTRYVVLDMEAPAERAGAAAEWIERDTSPAGEQGTPREVLRWEPPVDPAPVLDGWANAPDAPRVPEEDIRPSVPLTSAERAGVEVFGEAVFEAKAAHEKLESGIRDVLDDVRRGRSIDVAGLGEGIDAMLDSVGRNPGALSWVLEMQRKGDYIYRHGVACGILAATFGRNLGLDRPDLREVAIAALLCDVGKVRIPSELLMKKGNLRPDELQRLRSHVDESRSIIVATPGLTPAIAKMVEQHHERHDGSGYPRGLRGTQLLLGARIVGLVDSYDAMTSDRGYAERRSPHQAMMELYQTRDRLFEGALVEQFIRACGVYPTGTLIELSDGRVGVVMAVNSLQRLRPTVMCLLAADKQPLPEFATLDLSQVEVDASGAPLTVRAGLPPGAYGLDPAMLFLD